MIGRSQVTRAVEGESECDSSNGSLTLDFFSELRLAQWQHNHNPSPLLTLPASSYPSLPPLSSLPWAISAAIVQLETDKVGENILSKTPTSLLRYCNLRIPFIPTPLCPASVSVHSSNRSDKGSCRASPFFLPRANCLTFWHFLALFVLFASFCLTKCGQVCRCGSHCQTSVKSGAAHTKV